MSDTNHLARCLVLAVTFGIFCTVCDVSAQRILKGTIDQCHSVAVLDRNLPVDSLLIRPTLPDSVRSGVLLGMVGSCRIVSDTQNAIPLGDLGRMIDVSVVGITDSITVITPISLDSGWRTTTYQFIVPIESDTVTIDSIVTAPAWDGTSGGVVMIRARLAISFRKGIINVSGLGYAGGSRSGNRGDCGLSIPCDVAGSGLSGGKGDSPMRWDSLCRSGHRPWASGGGGGDAHNAGGGGGGSGGRGGRGGNQVTCGPPLGMWGMPGTGISHDSGDLAFMGGGGGGGHQNNSVATNGTAGGGIAILKSPLIMGDTLRISARGADAPRPAGNDGGGGGGAGGTVIIDACSMKCPGFIDVSGGRGSNADAGHGPGGGGAGGVVLIQPAMPQSSRARFTMNLDGGPSGSYNGQPTATYGAARGERGQLLGMCSSVKPHTVMISPRAAVGDTMHIDLIPNDTTLLCECTLEHAITIDGSSAFPLTAGTQLFSDVLLTTTPSRNTIAMNVVLPNRRSFRIPVLAVLSEDTTIDVRSSSRLYQSATNQQCSWKVAEQTITLSACGLNIRKVVHDVPFRATIGISSERIMSVEVETFANFPRSVRVYSSLGEQIADVPHCEGTSIGGAFRSEARFDVTSWSHGVFLVVIETPKGLRSVAVVL